MVLGSPVLLFLIDSDYIFFRTLERLNPSSSQHKVYGMVRSLLMFYRKIYAFAEFLKSHAAVAVAD